MVIRTNILHNYKHYGKKSAHKHKKISSVKDNEQSHSDDRSYFVNTIQDEEVHDAGAGISVLLTQV